MRAGRVSIIAALIVGLVVAGLARDLARAKRGEDVRVRDMTAGASNANLSSMNSFALALLLGGLRGPLVMILWSSSESQKADKNLEDFDTKVEWIRLLQPEFDSVHLFQIWNKAYNISVMMASLANKYITILDSLTYAERVDQQRPNDINILHIIGSIYFDKFGNSNEKLYYRKRVRDESKPHVSRQRLLRDNPEWRRLELDPVLDEKGNILPQYLQPSGALLSDPKHPKESYDGSALQFLKKYEPYPYGVSPFAFAYNYQKRAQLLATLAHQRHAQLSPLVIDSRPGLTLMFWSQEEMEYGRRLELQLYGKSVPTEKIDMELPTANVTMETPLADKSVLTEAIFCYGRSAQLAADSLKEFDRHIRDDEVTKAINNYASLMDGIEGMRTLALGDQAFLQAISTPAADRAEPVLKTSAENYRSSIRTYQLMILKYYTGEQLLRAALPSGVQSIKDLNPDQYGAVIARAVALQNRGGRIPPPDDRKEFETYIERAETRLAHLK